MAKDSNDKFSDQEARQRFEAALRGARAAGHKPMSEMKVSRPEPKSKKRKSVKKKA